MVQWLSSIKKLKNLKTETQLDNLHYWAVSVHPKYLLFIMISRTKLLNLIELIAHVKLKLI